MCFAELAFKTVIVDGQSSTWSRKPSGVNGLADPRRFVNVPWDDRLVVAVLCAGEIDGRDLSATECEFQDFVISLALVECNNGNLDKRVVDIREQFYLTPFAFRVELKILSFGGDALVVLAREYLFVLSNNCIPFRIAPTNSSIISAAS